MRYQDCAFEIRLGVGRFASRTLALVTVFILFLFVLGGTVLAKETEDDLHYPDLYEAIDAAAQSLVEAHQNADGGYSSFSAGADLAPSDVSGTADALIALAAAGHPVAEPIDYYRDHGDALIEFAGQDGSTAGKLVLALLAADKDPRDFRGHDFIADLSGHMTAAGHFGVESAFNQALAILALAEAGENVPDAAISWLVDQQAEDGDLAGSWDDGFGTAGNPDATAMAVIALLAAGLSTDDEIIVKAEEFFERFQLPDGNWEYGEGFGGNANSTALALRALKAMGYDAVEADGQFIKGSNTPLGALWLWQGESGAFQADFGEGSADDFFATVQAIPAMAAEANTRQEFGSEFVGGDSIVPYVMLGIVLVIFLMLVGWYVRARRN